MKEDQEDYIIPISTNPDNTVDVIRIQDGQPTYGSIKILESDQDSDPSEEVLTLEPNQDSITPSYRVTHSSKGPSKVNSKAYRANYDSIFGVKATVGQA